MGGSGAGEDCGEAPQQQIRPAMTEGIISLNWEFLMQNTFALRVAAFAAVIGLMGLFPQSGRAQALEPISYTLKVPAPDTHIAEVEAIFPTGGGALIEIMMAVWSPGFYRIEDYAQRVQGLSARTVDGAPLEVESTRKNRWRVHTEGRPRVVVTYRVSCEQRSVTTNYAGDDLGVINGAPTFITLVEQVRRPHEVRLELAPKWRRSVTALEPAADGKPNHYLAPDYDTLVDSPIVAGDPVVHEFEVDGSQHLLVDIGDVGSFDGQKAAGELRKIALETRGFWGFLPFKKYYYLNVFRRGGGGLEHKNSTLLTASAGRPANAQANFGWLSFVSHEYFHAFNVKRLRPVELGPFDYENPPNTSSLWISEGLTSYFGELIVVRAGLGSTEDYLRTLSSHINRLQDSPGRLVQTLEQSSLDVWSSGTSGVGRNRTKTVDYYVKGPIVGFLLDARIRRITAGRKSLDDVMRLAYHRYAGERGFTPEQFRAAADEVAGVGLAEWFRKAISSTEELDYSGALDWFGLRFATPKETEQKEDHAKKEAAAKWNLEVRPDASGAQKEHLQKLFEHAKSQ
jgi:predicted metalloprotease with PDZ domain